jgi:hypothetical protein
VTTRITVTTGDGGLLDRNAQQQAAARQAALVKAQAEKAAALGNEQLRRERIAQGRDPATGLPLPSFGTTSTIRRLDQQPAANRQVGTGTGWLLVPSGDYDQDLNGFRTAARRLPPNPFITASEDGWIRASDLSGSYLIKSSFVADPDTIGQYSSGPFTIPISGINKFTFECLLGGTGVPPVLNTPEIVLLGQWYWEYTLEQTVAPEFGSPTVNVYELQYFSRIIGWDPQDGYYIDTSPDGMFRPPPPSEWWDTFSHESELGPVTFRVLSEERIDMTPAGSVVRPPVEAASECSVVFSIGDGSRTSSAYFGISAIAVNPGDLTSIPPELLGDVPVPVEQSTVTMTYTAEQTEEGAYNIQYISEQPYEAFAPFRHFALVANQGSASLYLAGSRVGTVQVPVLTEATGQPLDMKVTISYSGPADGFVVSDEGADGDGGVLVDYVADRGFINAESQMKMKVKGVRFTAGRALYAGEAFTPPTSITRLA